MKTAKPKDLACLHRFYQDQGRYYLCLSALFFFPFDEPRALLSEQQLWPFATGQLGKQAPLDTGMPKPRGEFLVKGNCFVPGPEPAGEAQVEVRLGAAAKRLAVYGDRVWLKNSDHFDRMMGNSWLVSEPQPFKEMSIDWRHAYGGPLFPDNPLGLGFLGTDDQPEPGQAPLPNLEYPDQMMANPWSAPKPAGLLPLDITWPQRMSKSGTHDAHWLKTLFPGFAADMDWTIFNVSPEDQQIDGFWSGQEDISIKGMHPDKEMVTGRLPGIRPRVFLKILEEQNLVFSEVPLSLDTVWLFPQEEKGIMVYRGVQEISSWDGIEIKDSIWAYEYLGGQSRSPQDYQDSLAKRRSKKTAAFWLLREDDLHPPEGVPQPPEAPAPPRALGPMIRRAQNAMDEAEKEMGQKVEEVRGKLKELLAKHKLDPKKYLDQFGDPMAKYKRPEMPALPPQYRSARDLPALMTYMSTELPKLRTSASQIKSQAEAESKQATSEMAKYKDQAYAKVREACQRTGQDYDKVMKESAEKAAQKSDVDPASPLKKMLAKLDSTAGKPPNPAAASKLAEAKSGLNKGISRIKKAQAAIKKGEALEKKGEQALAKMKPSNLGAHALPPPVLKTPEQRLKEGQAALSDLAKGQSLAGRDLSGVDLTGARLIGADLRGTQFDSALLTNADLSGADLSGAIMARAELGQAKLKGAKLAGANLGHAQAAQADLRQADLTKAVVEGANFSGAKLAGAKLGVSLARKAIFAGADLSGASAIRASFIETDFKAAKLAGADLSRALFYQSVLDGADFSGAKAVKATFVKAKARDAKFDGADLSGVRLALGADFRGSSFIGAQAPGGNWRGSRLEGAQFSQALLDGGDFGRCHLEGADFYRASAKKTKFSSCDLSEANLTGVNLMAGSLMGARLSLTDFTGSNLFSVNLMNAKWDRTKLDGANIKRTTLMQDQV